MCHWLADQVFEGNPFQHPTTIVIVHLYRLYPKILSLRLKESRGPVAQKVAGDLTTIQPSPKAMPLQWQIHRLHTSVLILSVTMVPLIVMAIVSMKCGRNVILLSAVPDKHFPHPPVTIPAPRKGPQVLLAPLLPLPYLPPGWFACLNTFV